MRHVLDIEEKARLIDLLQLPPKASHEQIVERMNLVLEAQKAHENKQTHPTNTGLWWQIRLLEWHIFEKSTSILFWQYFFDYDAEHKLGFMATNTALLGEKNASKA